MRPLGTEEKVLVNTRFLDDHAENNRQPSATRRFVANTPGGAPLVSLLVPASLWPNAGEPRQGTSCQTRG